jgi:hypothetical protein
MEFIMTLSQAKKLARRQGCTIKKDDYDEYRVNFSGGREATAYYTDDLEDAVNTLLHPEGFGAIAMAREAQK